MARIPGILGQDEFGGRAFPARGIGPDFDMDDIGLGLGPIGWERACSFAAGRAAMESRQRMAAEEELELLRKLYGTVFSSAAVPKAYFSYDKKTKKWVYETDAYISDRAAFFGSTEEYETYRASGKEELDANKEAMRRVIEPPKAVRKQHADWKDAQDVFYAWTKKAFDKEALATDAKATPDFAAVIKAQMSESLKTKLASVRTKYKTSFTAGGYNPRPQKISGGYRLGTLSEHAVGNAIDIEDQKNPQIEGWRWALILAYTAKTWDAGAMAGKWAKDEANAKQVYDAFKGISDEWVSRLDKAVQASEAVAKKKAEDEAAARKKADEDAAKKAAEAAKNSGASAGASPKATPASSAEKKPVATVAAKASAAEAAKPAPPVDHLALVIAADKNLTKIEAPWVKEWKSGFLNLEWDLVKELRSAGFKWGAMFPNPDIHHFEL